MSLRPSQRLAASATAPDALADQAAKMVATYEGLFEGGDPSAFGEPGDYIAVCTLPIGGAVGGPPHFAEGMVAELTAS